ncbi:RluA family pseudouridine synthase [Emergencia timonensis]|uniref:Pseudouridine synthase n=1 Tax=Emergencia timonensis TaxID=1776384 RepID=A0A415E565_9FIRM|nr:RluA family pseudouridine synthase [Emergencia timonensis]MBS6177930.1 RluA family pseudouridine synthase [Clostridiales bacterium]MCB6476924.1 RluA family pseudouridine synthase [Emergencia timonensis]RHJ88739.1 RluA family pseudouridine synthase [Emergencia timonensis]
MAKFEYTVTKEDEGVPVKGLLRTKFSFSSRLLTKLKYQHLVFLNGEEVAGWITPQIGDILSIKLPEEKSDFPAEDIPIYPVFEDDDLLILNKQPGVIVHPTKGHPLHTIANGLMKYMQDTGQTFKIRFVNRLDMDTTGLLIVAKNSHSQDDLTKQMKANTIEKRYIAIVNGIVKEDAFTIDLPIGRPDPENVARGVMLEGGYPSVTHVKVLESFPKGKGYTMVELLLETGRTHQIRVHMSHIGYPLVGDYLYGGEAPWLLDRQALHAYKLSFNHPVTGKRLTVEAPLPNDIQEVIKKIKS